MSNTATATAEIAGETYVTEVVYGEGSEVRIYEQTASRDHNATIVPGAYAVRYTTVSYSSFVEGRGERRPYYACIDVMIDTQDRTQSSVEFGGVALAHESVKGARKPHTIVRYAYEMIEK
jgi:hypothetical protein